MTRGAPRRGTTSSDSAAARRIRQAAVAEFAQHGYSASTTRKIAARLGMSATAMYPHYESKEALLYDISKEGHLAALQNLIDADKAAANEAPETRLRSVVAAFARWHCEHAVLARILQYEIRSLSPGHYRHVSRLRRETVDVIRHILEVGNAAGAFRADPVAGVVLAISSLCVDVCRWFPSHEFTDSRELGELYAELAWRMVERAGAEGARRDKPTATNRPSC